ncbi:MAG: hypothetical protein JO046_08900, partial [Solirubrobacterales bacterium]|nr:hypothetical protein [Solirubrobacterales bacterium]
MTAEPLARRDEWLGSSAARAADGGELAGGRNPGQFKPKPTGSAADFGRQDEGRQVLETQAEGPQLVAGAMLVLDLAAAPVAFGTRRLGL